MLSGALVKTTTSDGLELVGFWMDQKSDIAVFHSHGSAGDFYSHKFIEVEGKKLATSNISFLSANNRGHDVYADIRKYTKKGVEWVQIGGGFEKFEDCIFDIATWLDFLAKHGVKKVILQAHSLTQKILYYQYRKHDPRVIGQIHISPCDDAGFMYYLLGEKKYLQVNIMVAKMVKQGKIREVLPKELSVVCPMGPLAYLGYLTEDGVGNLFPYHNEKSKKWDILASTREPLLAIYGAVDGFIKPSVKEAAELFKHKAVSTKSVKVQVIKDASHSYIGYEDGLIDAIHKWIKDVFIK